MGALLGILPALLPLLQKIIGNIFPDKEKQNQAMIQIQQALDEAQSKLIESSKEVILAEMNQGGWASKWRAYLMIMCTTMIGFNWMIAPVLNAFLVVLGVQIITTSIPPEAWTLVTIGVGGYLGKETMSTYTNAKYGKADFDIIREVKGSPLSQEDVDLINSRKK